MFIQNQAGIQGKLRIRKYRDGKCVHEQNETNRVVSTSGHGRNLIMRQLAGDTTYGIEVDEGKIGTDNTAPTDGDTDLGSSTLANITVESTTVSNDQATFSFFILDGDLADGTYEEFGLFIGSQMLARSVFTNSYSKSSGEDSRIDYQLTLNAS